MSNTQYFLDIVNKLRLFLEKMLKIQFLCIYSNVYTLHLDKLFIYWFVYIINIKQIDCMILWYLVLSLFLICL